MRRYNAHNNKEVLAKLSERVVGHDHAKKVLINLVNRSKDRYYQKWALLEEEDLTPLSNCLLIGDSGTGKTFLVESLSAVMNFPLIKIDATELNPTGASGGIKKKDLVNKVVNHVKEIMKDEQERRDDDPSYRGEYFSFDGCLDQVVVFVDEVDKLGQQLSSDWNAHVQANFLTLFENKGELANITFIFAGAFTGMDKHGKSAKQQIGFNHTEEVHEIGAGDLSQKVIKFGLIPELVGRMHNICLLDELKEEEYTKILLQNILPRVQKSLKFLDIPKFSLSKVQVKKLVKDAMKSGLGVRALETGVNKILVDIEFDPDAYRQKLL